MADMMQGAQDHLVESLANSAAFQALTESTTAEEAKGHIYQDILPTFEGDEASAAELTTKRPLALIFTDENASGYVYNRDATGCWRGRGAMAVKLERNTPLDGREPAEWDREFRESVGNIVRELAEQAETAGRLACEIIQAHGPYRIVEEKVHELGDFQWYELMILWGQE